MFFEPFINSVLLLALFIILPVIVHLPIYIFRFRRMKRIEAEKGPQFKPSATLLTLNVWIILVLVALPLGLPHFLVFNARGKQAEAKTNLGAIYITQVAYYGEHNTYAGRGGMTATTPSIGNSFADMGWTPEGDTMYTYYEAGGYIAPTKPASASGWKPLAPWPYPIAPEVSAHGFTAMAIGNIDRDACLDVWMINDAKVLTNLVDDRNDVAMPGMGGQCGESSAARRFWFNIVVGKVFPILETVLGLFALTSPLMLIGIPVMYYLAIKQNRLYAEALEAERETTR